MIAGLLQLARFENGLGQLLDKQRHAVGPGQDLLEQRRGQRLAAGERGDHRSTLRPGQLGQVQCADMSLLGPARLKLRPVGEHDQQRNGSHPVDQQIQHLQRGRVGPVRILEQHHAGLPAGGRFGDVDQGPQRLVLVLLRRHRQGAVALPRRGWTRSTRRTGRRPAAGRSA